MSNILNKIQWIADNSKPNNDLLIRTNNSSRSHCDGYEWFVHYTYDFECEDSDLGVKTTTVFKEYTNDLEGSLDKIIDIINEGNREVINKSMVF